MNRVVRMLAFHTFAIAACGCAMGLAAAETRAAPATVLLHIGNFTFNPQAVAVRAGTTITWVNDDDIPHTVVARNLAFKSKVLDTGQRFSFTFAKAGQFDYFCSLHPHMTGRVVVKA